MRTATDPEGNGVNPHVGPPVRLPFRLPLPMPHELTCLPCLSPEDQENKTALANPNDDTVQAGLATNTKSEGRNALLVREAAGQQSLHCLCLMYLHCRCLLHLPILVHLSRGLNHSSLSFPLLIFPPLSQHHIPNRLPPSLLVLPTLTRLHLYFQTHLTQTRMTRVLPTLSLTLFVPFSLPLTLVMP
jgi:hypothetical protein